MRLHPTLISLFLAISLHAGAWAQDKPAPNYKPYPEKASKAPVEKVP